tara:strand:- start:13781 stop:14140 length:360 start_codon:yes stop_codon:yes gene_type:complete
MNGILKFRHTFFLLFLTVSLSACLTNVDELEEIDPGASDPCADITFAIHIKPIIDSNCVQCHGNGGNFPNLTTYNGISANAASVKSETASRRMPQGNATLTSEEIQAISCWVDAGAFNN